VPGIVGLLFLIVMTSGVAQVPEELARERTDFESWLASSPISPRKAVARQVVGDGLSLGPPRADIHLPGLVEHRVYPAGTALMLESPGGTRPLTRSRPVQLGSYTLLLDGPTAEAVLTVFTSESNRKSPGFFSYESSLVFSGPLLAPQDSGRRRILGPSGKTVEASEAGSVLVPLGGRTRLKVLRIYQPGGEESELEIFFQDETNGKETYPAGRFVSLIPLPAERYRLDFNRARNPFCAYSPAYPCPIPWSGNFIRAPVPAGERYGGGGLEVSLPGKRP
jgi:Protein of unknown function (DUF1684)